MEPPIAVQWNLQIRDTLRKFGCFVCSPLLGEMFIAKEHLLAVFFLTRKLTV